MLDELRIKNFTIIKNLAVSFKDGLNILTGETGAGKSIIVDALSMFISPRASVELISIGAKEAQVEAVFYNVSDELIR
ncbi:MAG: AAA family ATPase, partial [Thermodesulfovibrionales bacterium]|nr:AAA family ATPase [Thermodesulfovibrionales bacterium]